LFDRLLSAFLQDLEIKRYGNMDELLNYCSFSANPVGRIVLHLHGYREQNLLRYSDFICSALQLTNFWQDVRVDAQKDRIYIPQNFMEKYRVAEDHIIHRQFDENFRHLMMDLTGFTETLYQKGLPLLKGVQNRLRWQLKFTISGGLRVLDKIRRLQYNVLASRPELHKGDWAQIAFKLFIPNRYLYE
jgi:squalene synthase HpnC